MRNQRVLIVAAVAVVVFVGLALVLAIIYRPAPMPAEGEARVNVLADSVNACVQCHANTTPGIVEQYGMSSMAAADVECQACHEVPADYPNAIEHEGTWVSTRPRPPSARPATSRKSPSSTRAATASRRTWPWPGRRTSTRCT